MAGLDRMYNAQADIQSYIEKNIRELLEEDMNELQDPNWVQAATLFEHVVIPCISYTRSYLYDLAKDIVKKAEENDNRVVYRDISPKLYNQEVIDSKSVDLNNLPECVNVVEYDDLIEKIKKWMTNYRETMAQIE